MPHSVIIEGSVTPAAGVLARGERRTVAWTDHIKDLIDRGYVVLIETLEEYEDEYPTPVQSEPSLEADKHEWLSFLSDKGISVPVNSSGETPEVDGLRSLWQQVVGGY